MGLVGRVIQGVHCTRGWVESRGWALPSMLKALVQSVFVWKRSNFALQAEVILS